MQPGEIYLDALFPLVVQKSPRIVMAPTDHECTFILCSPDVCSYIGKGPGEAVENGYVWMSASGTLRIRSEGDAWGVLVGRKLLDQLVVASFGEPGFSRFLDELTGDGIVRCGIHTLDEAASSCEKLIIELREKRPAYRTHSRSLLTGFFMALYRAGLSTDSGNSSDTHRLSVLIDYIDLNYAEDITVHELAKRSGYSSSHFSRVFSRRVGVPVSEYINRLRIREACLLLKRDDRSITEIAFEVGYNNVSFFNRYFRRVMNMTPREYRRYLHQ